MKKPFTILLFARIVVLPIDGDEINKESLIIPSEAYNNFQFGKVIQVGTDIKHCKEEDTIMWKTGGGDELIIDDKLHFIMNESEVFSVL